MLTVTSSVSLVLLLNVCFCAGTPLDDAGEVLAHSPVSIVPDMEATNEASNIIKGLARMPAPPRIFSKHLIDPQLNLGVDLCERDFKIKCPEQFVNVGLIFGGSTEYCAATAEYEGPCASEAVSFEGMSAKAKSRWSDLCQAFFPCIECTRDFEVVCPKGWVRLNDTLSCAPPPTYTGPCRGEDAFEYTLGRDTSSSSYLQMISTDFSGYNAAMLGEWSAECGAFWPCLE